MEKVIKKGLWIFNMGITSYYDTYWRLDVSKIKKNPADKDSIYELPNESLLKTFNKFKMLCPTHVTKENTTVYLYGDRLHGYNLLLAFGHFEECDLESVNAIAYLMSRLAVWGHGPWIEHYAPLFGEKLIVGIDYVDKDMVKYVKANGKKMTRSEVWE